MRQDGSKKLRRVIMLEMGGLVGFHAVSGTVRPTKGVPLKPKEKTPNRLDLL